MIGEKEVTMIRLAIGVVVVAAAVALRRIRRRRYQ
jgi:hypothetical protein